LAHENRSARLRVVYVVRAKLVRDCDRDRTKTTVDFQNSATDQGRKNSIDDAAPLANASLLDHHQLGAYLSMPPQLCSLLDREETRDALRFEYYLQLYKPGRRPALEVADMS
jgi:hypothetical protein